MATIVCVLCGIYAIGEETVFIIETDSVHCEEQGGAEERAEPEHVIQRSTPRYQQNWQMKLIKFYSHQLMHFFIHQCISLLSYINTFTAIDDLSRFNNSRLKLPASTLVDLTFQPRTLRSFSLNQLRDLSL